jgi:hypothetical protein
MREKRKRKKRTKPGLKPSSLGFTMLEKDFYIQLRLSYNQEFLTLLI